MLSRGNAEREGMEERLIRQLCLTGEEGTEKLKSSAVAVIGLGGVGGACVEALARCGTGRLLLMDGDVFSESNLNRQLLCTVSNIGLPKAEEAKKRVEQIAPGCEAVAKTEWLTADTLYILDEFRPDFVIDAVDRVTAKLQIIEYCREKGIPVISCMGTGNRMDPHGFRTGTAADTAGCGCPLAKVMRRELTKRGLQDTPVLFSTTLPVETHDRTPGSISFVPPVAGFELAAYAVRTLLEK